jgi:two-component system, NtrC family, response regulator
VRVVAATNQDLERGVSEGSFRNDLYHRLSQFTLKVSPLRDRIEDIAPLALARHILWQHDRDLKLTHRAVHALEAHSWPGNIRELRNVVIKAAVMAPRTEIDADDLHIVLPSAEAPQTHGMNGCANLDGMERRMILEALVATGGHQQNAAARLGISRRTLSRKLRSYAAERMSAAS